MSSFSLQFLQTYFEALRSARVLASYRNFLELIRNLIIDPAGISNLPIDGFAISGDEIWNNQGKSLYFIRTLIKRPKRSLSRQFIKKEN